MNTSGYCLCIAMHFDFQGKLITLLIYQWHDIRLQQYKTTTLFILLNPFSTNAPLTDKPGNWFLLAKCLKTPVEESSTWIFIWNFTLPQAFFKHFASKNQLPGS